LRSTKGMIQKERKPSVPPSGEQSFGE